MPLLPPPTDAELDILRLLWERGPSTVREIHDALGEVREVGYTTILKQMQVMHQKGLLHRSERFRSHVYDAVQSKEATQRQIATSILRQVFDGSARSLLQSALAGRRVDRKEMQQLRDLLHDYERRQK
jgi:BlaI family transcriptional regulator, penicillinase repressor